MEVPSLLLPPVSLIFTLSSWAWSYCYAKQLPTYKVTVAVSSPCRQNVNVYFLLFAAAVFLQGCSLRRLRLFCSVLNAKVGSI